MASSSSNQNVIRRFNASGSATPASPNSGNHVPNLRSRTSLFDLISILLRAFFWPIVRLSNLLFPCREYDGLSMAVTEKAAKQFVNYLKTIHLSNRSNDKDCIDAAFNACGFATLNQEAAATQSLILIYLHSPVHPEDRLLCEKLLLQTPMLDFLIQNLGRSSGNRSNGSDAVDASSQQAQHHILGGLVAMGASIHTSQGASLSYQLNTTSFPVLALLQPSTSANSSNNNTSDPNRNGTINNGRPAKVVFKAEGECLQKMSSTQCLQLITATYQKHQIAVQEREARKIQQQQEAQLRIQQDQEYQEALRMDQEKEQQKQEEQKQLQQLELEKLEKEMADQDLLQKAQAMLRPEPSETGGNKSNITRIRFQLPSGQKLERRFERDETIGSLKAFLLLHFVELSKKEGSDRSSGSIAQPVIKNISLSSNFPKKVFEEDNQTLEDADLCPQAVLMVQDLDA